MFRRVLSRVFLRVLPAVCAAATALSSITAPVGAQTAVGVIRGTVTDAKTKAPIAGARVSATSAGAQYSATTDARGHYVILSVLPDTYVLSVVGKGYQSASAAGITVLAGTVQTYDVALTAGLATIATVKAHRVPQGSAFQPGMTTDNYNLTDQQITMVQGKAFNTDENQLLRSIPSVTIDKSGTVSIRGGFAFEASYEFEGIDYTTPTANLQNTLQNIGNFSMLNGVGGVQLIPGAGDATHGDTGTGLVLLSAKHGTYPGSLHADFETDVFPYMHQLGLEWGIADPKGDFSNFASFLGVRRAYQYGINGVSAATLGSRGTNAATLGSEVDPNIVYYSPSFLKSDDFVDNMIYRFGGSSKQYRLQFFIQNQNISQDLDYGGYQNLLYASGLEAGCAQAVLVGPTHSNPSANSVNCATVIPLYPGQKSTGAYVTSSDQLASPFEAYKFEFGDNINSNLLMTVRYDRTFSEQSQELPSQGIYAAPFGGYRNAANIDFIASLGANNLLKSGLTYGYTKPFGDRYDVSSYTAFTAFSSTPFPVSYFPLVTWPLTHNGVAPPLGTTPPNFNDGYAGLTADFYTPSECASLAGSNNSAQHCGYLSSYFPNGVRFPMEHDSPTVSQQTYGAYLQDDATFGNKWKSEMGLRLDGYNFLLPPSSASTPIGINAVAHQRLYEPHLNFTYTPGVNDVLRIGYGRTLSMPLPSQVGVDVMRDSYAAFDNIPSYNNYTGSIYNPANPTKTGAQYCGLTANQPCVTYANQLYWLARDYRFGAQNPEVALHGATFANYDLSWAHQFSDGSAVKLTPFFRRGYDVIEQTAQIVGFNSYDGEPIYGYQSYSNLGQQRATGVEFLYTRDRPLGWSSQIGATYINQFGNEPPGAYLTPASLAAGVQYRSPDLSPFQVNAAFRYKTRTGWTINPVISANIGYPYGAGYYTAIMCNGKAVIVPTTDLSTYFPLATNYVDPENPGTCSAPNIAATRGNTEPANPGGVLSSPQLNVDLTFEYQHPGSNGLFGLQIQNLTNHIFNVPVQNTCYGTPVTTGVNTGTAPCTYSVPQFAAPDATSLVGPYVAYPNLQPLTIRLYYQVRI